MTTPFSPYWGEVPPEDMRSYLEKARNEGYERALVQASEDWTDLSKYLLSEVRLDWLFHCYDSSRSGAVLDIGSGWGALAFPLSEFYDEVWSLETVRERLQFQSIRRRQTGSDNVKLLCASVFDLPFGESSFDGVVVNGVLEWVGTMSPTQLPDHLQAVLLREISRILKPSGYVYVGIENRFGIQYWLGERDHSGLRWTSLMPRPLASLVSRVHRFASRHAGNFWVSSERGSGYRTYTHSYSKYRRMFREAGFGRVDSYWVVSSYNYPKFSGPVENAESLMEFVDQLSHVLPGDYPINWQRVRHLIEMLPGYLISNLWKQLTPSFLWFAYKSGIPDSIEKDLLSKYKGELLLRSSGSDGITGRVNFIIRKMNGHKIVVRLLRHPDLNGLAEESQNLERFTGVKPVLEAVGRWTVMVTDHKDLGVFNTRSEAHVKAAIQWLADFQSKTGDARLSVDCVRDEIAHLAAIIDLGQDEGMRDAFVNQLSPMVDEAAKGNLITVSEHGDFWPGNILFDKSHKAVVLDWEYFRESGNPLLDPGALLFSLAVRGRRREISFKRNIEGFGPNSRIISYARKSLSKHLGLSEHLIGISIPYAMARRVSQFRDVRGTWSPMIELLKRGLRDWLNVHSQYAAT